MIQITVQYVGPTIGQTQEEIIRHIRTEVIGRGHRVSNQLTNAVAFVMRGQGGGYWYRIPGTRAMYQASAPGEPPAVRTGVYRASFQSKTTADGVGGADLVVHSITESRLTVNGYQLWSRRWSRVTGESWAK